MEKIDRLGWVVQDNYDIDGAKFGIRFSSEPFADLIRNALAPFETSEDVDPFLSIVAEAPGKGSIKKYSIIYRGSTEVLSTLSPQRLFLRVLAESARLRMVSRDESMFVATTMVVANGSVVLLPGVAASLRKDIGRRLTRLGIAFSDDEYASIDLGSPVVRPTQLPVEVTPTMLEGVSALWPEPARRERFVPVLTDEKAIAATVVWGPQDGDRIGRPPAAVVLRDLASRTVNRVSVGPRVLESLARVVQSGETFSVAYTPDAQQAFADLVRDIVRK
jgi:hypothetical protein